MKKIIFIIVVMFSLSLMTSCKKIIPATEVWLANLQITSPQASGGTIASGGTYQCLNGKFQFNWKADNPSNCKWMVNITFHDGDDVSLRISGLNDIENVMATLPTGSIVLDLSMIPAGKLVQVNIVFDPVSRTKKGNDQLTFYVRR